MIESQICQISCVRITSHPIDSNNSLASRRFQLFVLTLLLGILLWKPAEIVGQVRFGVQWNPPEDSVEFDRQLSALQSLSITKLQLVPPVSKSQLRRLRSYEFQIYINPPLRFIIGNHALFDGSTLADTLGRFVKKYESYDHVTAIGLLDRSELYNAEFAQRFTAISEKLEPITEKNLFISSAFPELKHLHQNRLTKDSNNLQAKKNVNIQLVISDISDLHSRHQFFSYLYAPKNVSVFKQKQFRTILDSLKKKKDVSDLFISGGWLSERLNESSDIAVLIKRYQHDDQATFEVNESDDRNKASLNWSVFLLLIIFGSFAFHLHYSPTYRKSLYRYFRTHMFFVDDIAKRHIRGSMPGYVILLQHVLSTCIMLYLVFVSILDETGWQVILQYFPLLNSLYDTLPYIIIPSAVLALAIESAVILFIYLTNKSVRYINQVLLLYSWPLQIGIVVAALALILSLKTYPSYYLLILSVIFVINWLGSFLIAIFDLSFFTNERKTFFVSVNSGLFIIILGVLTYYYISYNVYDVVLLAVKLSG